MKALISYSKLVQFQSFILCKCDGNVCLGKEERWIMNEWNEIWSSLLTYHTRTAVYHASGECFHPFYAWMVWSIEWVICIWSYLHNFFFSLGEQELKKFCSAYLLKFLIKFGSRLQLPTKMQFDKWTWIAFCSREMSCGRDAKYISDDENNAHLLKKNLESSFQGK